MKLGDNVPVWVREKRRPTRAELAAQHFADGGTSATGGSSLPDDDPPGTEYELVTLSESSPGILIRRPKAAAPAAIKMRKFK